jgi:hypothetical protein
MSTDALSEPSAPEYGVASKASALSWDVPNRPFGRNIAIFSFSDSHVRRHS